MRRRIALFCMITLLAGCREGDGPADPSITDAQVYLTSSPNGADISIDNRATGQTTPDTVGLRRGDRAIALRLDTAGLTYSYGFILQVEDTDSVPLVEVPLGLQCLTSGGTCFQGARRHHDAAGIRFATSAVGSLFHWGGSGSGIFWPSSLQNSYASAGMPMFAAIADGDTLSLGMYDQSMLVGRPLPQATTAAGEFRLEQQAWILPPPSSLVRATALRGILIEEEVVARDDTEGVLLVRLTFRNVSDDPLVHRYAPRIPDAPVTYTDAWIGFALDPDIGSAGDDWLSYDVDTNTVFAYDSDFLAPFAGSEGNAPGLLGMRVLESPPGTGVMLNSWYNDFDWSAGRPGEQAGYGVLSGTREFGPEHPHPQIGHMPAVPGDLRMSVAAGPLTLAPGDDAQIVVAVAIAAPAAPFTSGEVLAPGDPLDSGRALNSVAANLYARMLAAEGIQ